MAQNLRWLGKKTVAMRQLRREGRFQAVFFRQLPRPTLSAVRRTQKNTQISVQFS
jgi:hypothetical protein